MVLLFLGVAANGSWSLHSIELALWTHFVASELKPELLDGIPCANGSTPVSVSHQNGDVTSIVTKSSEVGSLLQQSDSRSLDQEIALDFWSGKRPEDFVNSGYPFFRTPTLRTTPPHWTILIILMLLEMP